MNPLNIAKSALQKIFKSADIDDYVRSRGLSAVDNQFKNAVYACILGFAASGVYKLSQVVSATQNNVITATKQS